MTPPPMYANGQTWYQLPARLVRRQPRFVFFNVVYYGICQVSGFWHADSAFPKLDHDIVVYEQRRGKSHFASVGLSAYQFRCVVISSQVFPCVSHFPQYPPYHYSSATLVVLKRGGIQFPPFTWRYFFEAPRAAYGCSALSGSYCISQRIHTSLDFRFWKTPKLKPSPMVDSSEKAALPDGPGV